MNNVPIKGISKTKKQALKDISKECGIGKFFTKNYLHYESAIREVTQLPAIILSLDY